MDRYFTIFWDDSKGYSWDKSFDNMPKAYGFYKKLKAPFKKLTMTDRRKLEEHDVLSSTGTDNIDSLGLRPYIW